MTQFRRWLFNKWLRYLWGRKKARLLLVCIFSACSPDPKVPKPATRDLTDLQKQYLAEAPLAEKVYLEGCLGRWMEHQRNGGWLWSFTDCQTQMARDLNPPRVETKGDGSILKTAVGAAIGYGVVKSLTGRRRK